MYIHYDLLGLLSQPKIAQMVASLKSFYFSQFLGDHLYKENPSFETPFFKSLILKHQMIIRCEMMTN